MHRAYVDLAFLRRVAWHAAAAEGYKRGDLSIAIVGLPRMARLHEKTMGIAGATDVLTFDWGTDRRHRIIDGEIVACGHVAETVARQRMLPRWDPSFRAARDVIHAAARAELALYIVHGVLHLAGYDDRTKASFRKMHAREDMLLTQLGLGNVFTNGRQ